MVWDRGFPLTRTSPNFNQITHHHHSRLVRILQGRLNISRRARRAHIATMTSSYMARRPIIPMSSADIYAQASPYYDGGPSWLRGDAQGRLYLTEESNRRLQDEYERQRLLLDERGASAFPGGTILHKGFYDLLALSAPVVQSVSRFWNVTAAKTESSLVAGPQYERLEPATPPRLTNVPASSAPTSPVTPVKKRRISKDMVSTPRGFQ